MNEPRPLFVAMLLALLLSLSGCGRDGELPLDWLRNRLRDVPTYSILLEDMNREGNFFKTHYHKYRIVQDDRAWSTDWMKVPESVFEQYRPLLGMVVAGRKDGEPVGAAAPPGYQYAGDTRYGRWRNDAGGRSFWEFYGQYSLVRDMMGGWYRPIYRDDYDAYRQSTTRNVPFFGKTHTYGTAGTVARQANPDFFQRRMGRERAAGASFAQKVGQRTGRSRSNLRGRSGGRGK
jgi:hypothetical protein